MSLFLDQLIVSLNHDPLSATNVELEKEGNKLLKEYAYKMPSL